MNKTIIKALEDELEVLEKEKAELDKSDDLHKRMEFNCKLIGYHDAMQTALKAMKDVVSPQAETIEEIREILYSHSCKSISADDVVSLVRKEILKS